MIAVKDQLRVASSNGRSRQMPGAGHQGSSIGRLLIFCLEMIYLAGLLAAAGFYFSSRSTFAAALPSAFGPVPLGVPWFGALGAVTTGLSAVFVHEHDWKDSFAYWHVARPFMGATLGIVASLIVASLAATIVPGAPPSNAGLSYVVAFTVGYRERLFRQLIKRVTNLFFRAGRSEKGDGVPAGPHHPGQSTGNDHLGTRRREPGSRIQKDYGQSGMLSPGGAAPSGWATMDRTASSHPDRRL